MSGDLVHTVSTYRREMEDGMQVTETRSGPAQIDEMQKDLDALKKEVADLRAQMPLVHRNCCGLDGKSEDCPRNGPAFCHEPVVTIVTLPASSTGE